MASFAIGAKLRQERIGRGLTVDDISRDTRISPRYLAAIEADDFSNLPGLIFVRNFVRQYAVALELDPDPLLAELPKQDEASVHLPNPPERRHSSWRSSYDGDRQLRSLLSSLVWLLVAGCAGAVGYMHFNRTAHLAPRHVEPASTPSSPIASASPAAGAATAQNDADQSAPAAAVVPAPAPALPTAPVQVSLTAHAAAWIQITADGKTAFEGTLQPDEKRDISAAELVKILTGNAGALTISLNGKTLDSLGPIGQVRTVRLTAEGPELLSKAPPPAPDPL